VGRAGRAVAKSYGILLSGAEDDEIQKYFIESAFPSLDVFREILQALERNEGLSINEFLAEVNTSRSNAEKALKLLEVDGAVGQTYEKKVIYFRTPNPWEPDTARIERLLSLRQAELAQMQAYVDHRGCLMEFLQRALDDPGPGPCGRCANCRGRDCPTTVLPELVLEAETFLKGAQILITPRKRWPEGIFSDQKRTIPADYQNAPGRSLCFYGDSGWGKLVRAGKYVQGAFSDELVAASARLIRELWRPEPAPEWVTAIPSDRHPVLVPDIASRLARELGLPYHPALRRVGAAPEQKTMQNSSMQARNVLGTLAVEAGLPSGPVLLVDDIIDSGWTLAMAGYLLRENGSGPVIPFTLARATGRNTI
jgi:ATP-dependent DNA helicase RecQ